MAGNFRTIPQYNTIDAIAAEDQFLVFDTSNQIRRKCTAQQIADFTGGGGGGTPIGDITATGTSTPRSLEDRFADNRNVLDDGATPNDATDDYAAIQASLSSGARMVYLPQGNYNISSTLVIPSQTTMRFDDATLFPTGKIDMLRSAGNLPTVYTALDADVSEGSNSITTTAAIAGAASGSYIAIRSQDPISGTNTKGTKCLFIANVISVSGSGPFTYILDRPVYHDFTVANSAEAGLADMRTDITLLYPQLNNINYTQDANRGIVLQRCAKVNIFLPKIYGTKPVRGQGTEGSGLDGQSAIVLRDCIDVNIYAPHMEAIAWYGVAIAGACDNVKIFGGSASDVRHGVDITWETQSNQQAGEPTNIKTFDFNSYNCTLSGFSTHENGKNIEFHDCGSFYSGTELDSFGFFIRNFGTKLFNCIGKYNTFDGFRFLAGSSETEVFNCEASFNGRNGFAFQGVSAYFNNVIATDNASSGIEGSPIYVNGARLERNVFTGLRLYEDVNVDLMALSDIYAPSGGQSVGIRIEDGLNAQDKVKITGTNNFTGYGNALFSMGGTGNNSNIPITDGGIVTAVGTSTNPISGFATLVAGTVTITTNAVRKFAGSGSNGDIYTKIRLTVTSPSGTTGNIRISSITDQVSFTVLSDSGADTSTFYWELGV